MVADDFLGSLASRLFNAFFLSEKGMFLPRLTCD